VGSLVWILVSGISLPVRLLAGLPVDLLKGNNQQAGKPVFNLMSKGLDYKRFFRFAILPLMSYFIHSLMERLSPKRIK
jgi:hypothetical protein